MDVNAEQVRQMQDTHGISLEQLARRSERARRDAAANPQDGPSA